MAQGSPGYGSGAADRNGHTGRTTLHCYGPGFYFAGGRECIHLEPKATGAVEGKSLDSAGRPAWQSPGSDPLRATKRAITGHILRCDHPVRLPYRKIDLRSEEHTSELQSQFHLVCRLLLEKKNKI